MSGMGLKEQIGPIVCAKKGHDWEAVGGRACPVTGDKSGYGSPYMPQFCTQAAYVCQRCGLEDYGEAGGPGHTECMRICGMRGREPDPQRGA